MTLDKRTQCWFPISYNHSVSPSSSLPIFVDFISPLGRIVCLFISRSPFIDIGPVLVLSLSLSPLPHFVFTHRTSSTGKYRARHSVLSDFRSIWIILALFPPLWCFIHFSSISFLLFLLAVALSKSYNDSQANSVHLSTLLLYFVGQFLLLLLFVFSRGNREKWCLEKNRTEEAHSWRERGSWNLNWKIWFLFLCVILNKALFCFPSVCVAVSFSLLSGNCELGVCLLRTGSMSPREGGRVCML